MKTLLIDDDPFALKLLARQLQNLGCTALALCERARDALDLLEAQPDAVGLVFCDLQMPGIDGVELVRDNQPLSLKVAQQLRRPEGGNWTVRAAPAAAPASGGAVYGLPPESTGPVEIPADASEALKRLLKNREKQLSK